MPDSRLWCQWQGGRSVVHQAMGVLAVCLYVAWLHADNSGLWAQGDAPRHAMNGLFWWDFLRSFPVNPVEFALSYHARYPAINPVTYPPVFYLIEGTAFAIFGPNPYVAKGLVLLFACLAGVYVMAWLRRWVSEEAGWGGVLLLLQPGVIRWSHAVMLNIPSMALGIAALYHGRRWMEAPTSRHMELAFLFGVLTIMTYFPAGLMVMVLGVWLVISRRWDLLRMPKTWVFTLLSAMIIVPWVVMAGKWAPTHLEHVLPSTATAPAPDWWKTYFDLDRWLAYVGEIPKLFSGPMLGFAALAVGFGLWLKSRRRETWMLLVWSVVCYAGLSYLDAKESRYALILTGAIVMLGVIGLAASVTWLTARLNHEADRVIGGGLAALIAFHLLSAPFTPVWAVRGFEDLVAFLGKEAPGERVFYDGSDDGVFTFYVRANDPQFTRSVVLGSKLLYASTIFANWNLTERVASTDEVTEAFRRSCGCKWLVIEETGYADEVAAARLLRAAVTGKEFQLVKSFPVALPRPSQINVYRFLPPVETPDRLTMPFPGLGRDKSFQIKPISR